MTTDPPPRTTMVVPTVGRPTLQDLLDALGRSVGPPPERVVLADDRAHPDPPLLEDLAIPPGLRDRVTTVVVGGRGPAAARNAGWRLALTEWVVFVDDDVRPPPNWLERLALDLQQCGPRTAASAGRIVVPLSGARPPTDWERNVAALEDAHWATADMAYRRAALVDVGGFDESFRRAYREDADLALRVRDAGWDLAVGERRMVHPVRPAPPSVSLRMQAGNYEDPYMRRRHGPDWRARAGVPKGRRPWHLATVAAALLGIGAMLAGRRRVGGLAMAAAVAADARFAAERIAPGPRTPAEVATMLGTSLVLPFLATWHWLRGIAAAPGRLARHGRRRTAVLFDRDGTLVHDVPYNGDPARVEPVAGAREAVEALRRHGVPVGVVTNQSGIARGLLTPDDADAVNARIDVLVGPLDTWVVCPHGPEDGCGCRKPASGMVLEAAERLGVDPRDCVVIGDVGADMEAAEAAGAHGILVPTRLTFPAEVEAAPEVAPDLPTAVDRVLARIGAAR